MTGLFNCWEGDLTRIELLAKEKVEEWDAVGCEVNGLDIRDFLKGVGDNEGSADLSGA